MTDLLQVEDSIAQLVQRFALTPFEFFSEGELHAEFYRLGRDRFGAATTQDGHLVTLFRHEYNTVGRYARAPRGESFHARLHDEGKAGALDFAILNAEFVRSNELLVVINKHEPLRVRHRSSSVPLHAVNVAIEFKLAHIRDAMTVRQAAITDLLRGIREDCRKLAHECRQHAYLLAFSHGPLPNEVVAREALDAGTREFGLHSALDLHLLLATPRATYLKGPWQRIEAFPNPRLLNA